MQDILDVFTQPDRNRPLQKLYFPQIHRVLRDAADHDRYISYKLTHNAQDYARNLFSFYFDGLIKDEKRLLGWAKLHYGGGHAEGASESADSEYPEFYSPRMLSRSHVDYAEYFLYKTIMTRSGRVPCINPATERDWLLPQQYNTVILRGRISVVKYTDGNHYVVRENYEHDKQIAYDLETIKYYRFVEPSSPLSLADTAHLTKSQAAVIEHVRTNTLTFAPGGAGTGKTTIILTIIRAYLKAGLIHKVIILCPTNMAIENIRIRLGKEFDEDTISKIRVITIHSLAYKGSAEHPTDTLIIFEESSMYDNILGKIVARNVGNRYQCRYLFTGDASQLPPVVRHSVFRFILARFKEQTIRLLENFRSADLIIKNSTAILMSSPIAGSYPQDDYQELSLARLSTSENYTIIHSDMVGDLDWSEPLHIIAAGQPLHTIADQLMFITYRNADVLRINSAVRNLLLETPQESPLTRTDPDLIDLDTLSFDESAEEVIGITSDPTKYRIHPVYYNNKIIGLWEWRIGDKCRSLKNDPKGRIANGSIGRIAGFDKGQLIVSYRSHLIPYHYSDLWPAYCITVHNSQGQEWDNVIFCELSGEPLQRALFYVAATRARKKQFLMRVMTGSSSDLPPTDFLITDTYERGS